MKRLTANIAFFVLFTGLNPVGAQVTDTTGVPLFREDMNQRYRSTAILIGANWQPSLRRDVGTLFYSELGLARMVHQYSRHGALTVGVLLSEEMYFGKESIFGTKAGMFLHGMGIDMGFSAVYYTDFKKGNFKLRPEFGIGMLGFRAVVGFNIPTVRNKDFYRLQKNYGQITVQLMLGVKKKEIDNNGKIIQDLFKN